jgi:hypothetical protein
MWSWGWLALLLGLIGVPAGKQHSRRLSAVGLTLAAVLIALSFRIEAVPWKVHFNTEYGRRLLAGHARAEDPDYAYAVYTGNLILAQAALDNNDIAGGGRPLLEAAAAPGLPPGVQNGPDMTVAAALLQLQDRETVLRYLQLCHRLWPDGIPVLTRWETAIRNGRRVNFNNRVINPQPAERFTLGQ